MNSKIKISDLRDKILIRHQTGEHDTDGMPGRSYTDGPEIYAKLQRSTVAHAPDEKIPDKYKVVQMWDVLIRKEGYPIKINDRINYFDLNLNVEAIEDVDIWYQKLKCSDAD